MVMRSVKEFSWCSHLASSDKHILVNQLMVNCTDWKIYQETIALLTCSSVCLSLTTQQDAAVQHEVVWLPFLGTDPLQLPVQEPERWPLPRFHTRVWQCLRYQALTGHAGWGKIPSCTLNANYNAWCACLTCLSFRCMTYLIL